MAIFVNYELGSDSNLDEKVEVVVAKVVLDKRYVWPAPKPARVKETIITRAKDTQVHSLDINKLDEIFNLLMKDSLIGVEYSFDII